MRSWFVVALAAWSVIAPSGVAGQPVLPPNFVDDFIIGGLHQPISIAFLPDGRLLVTEKVTGNVRMIVNGAMAHSDPVLTVPNVTGAWDDERGLQGIAVDPGWPQRPYLYLCHTSVGDRMRLVRYTGSGQLQNPSGGNLSFGSPLILIDDFRDIHPVHNGLGLRFGTDGRLLMSVGDDTDQCSAQNVDSLRGKLLRLDVSRLPSGGGGPVPRALLIPPDNPFSGPDSNARLVYALGLRNPWRFHVDPMNGAILLADVGWNDYEELDEVLPGDNFGWPYREGPEVHVWPECGPESGPYKDPILALDRSTGFATILTAGVYRPVTNATANWPSEYWGNLFYCDVYYARLRRLVRAGNGWTAPPSVPGQPNPTDWGVNVWMGTDFGVGPDGSLYWIRLNDDLANPANGELHRIRYTGPAVAVEPGALTRRILRAEPNPFHGEVRLRWQLERSGFATVEILDLSGRRLRRLRDERWGTEGELAWDGRDENGFELASGVYLARILTPGRSEVVRLLKLD